MVAMKRRAHLNKLLALASGLMGLGAWASSAPTAQPLPTPFPEARYERMSAKSPFAVASASAAPAATPGFAAQLFIDGVAHVGNTDFVAIKSRDPEHKSVLFLEVGMSTDDGMKIDAVQWSPEIGRSTVDVSKGGEKATLEFDGAQVLASGFNGAQVFGNGLVVLAPPQDDSDPSEKRPTVYVHPYSKEDAMRRLQLYRTIGRQPGK
jgi:hypothetical protein